jgi:hypothetical protein
MRTHGLKCHPEPFTALLRGTKTFEFRKDDRGFAVGDLLHLREWDHETGLYSGRDVVREVTYVLRGPAFGVPFGYVVMSCAPDAKA